MEEPNHQIHYQQLIPHNATHNQQVNAQSEVAALGNLEMTTSESYMNMGGPFVEYHTVVAAHANSSQSNIVFSENLNNSSSAVAVTAPVGSGGHSSGAEVDILQAALHLADISEEELKAEELHTSLYPMQESHDMLPSLVANETLTATNAPQGSQLVNSYTSSEEQNHLVIATPEECNAQILSQSSGVNQNLMSVNVNDSQVMMSQQRPTVVMSAQIQPSFQPPTPPTTAKSSNSRKRKASSSNQSSTSSPNGPTTPRSRGRPKSPKGQPKNTPKKKPQPFISTYNGQKVMYIPVPCPPNGETPEMSATSDVLPPSVLSAAAQSLALNGNNTTTAAQVKGAPMIGSSSGQQPPDNCYPNGCSSTMSSNAVIPGTVTTSQLQMSPCVEVKPGPATASPGGILSNGDGCSMTMSNHSNIQLNSLPKITTIPAQQPPINSAINGPDVTNRTLSVPSALQVATASKIQQQQPQLIQLTTPCSQSTGVPVQSIVAATGTPAAVAPNVTKVFPPVTQDGAKKIAIPSISHSTDTTTPIKVQIAPVVQQTVSHTLLQPVGVSLGSSSSCSNSTSQAQLQQHQNPTTLIDVNCGGLATKREAQQGVSAGNGIRIQPNVNVNVSAAPLQHQPGSHQSANNGNKQQQQMLTFHIVQNPKTGAIEFIPVGNSGGKGMTQIQIIPKPIVPKGEDSSKPQTPGGKMAPVKVNGKTESKSKSAANTSKKQSNNSAQSLTGKVQGRKRGRPPTRTNSEIDAKHKEAVGRVTAALNSIGAIVSPVPSTQVNTIKKITPLPQAASVNMNGANVPVSNGTLISSKPAIILNLDPLVKNSNGGATTLKVATDVSGAGLNASTASNEKTESKAAKSAEAQIKNGAPGTNTSQQKASSKNSKVDDLASTGTAAKSRKNTNDPQLVNQILRLAANNVSVVPKLGDFTQNVSVPAIKREFDENQNCGIVPSTSSECPNPSKHQNFVNLNPLLTSMGHIGKSGYKPTVSTQIFISPQKIGANSCYDVNGMYPSISLRLVPQDAANKQRRESNVVVSTFTSVVNSTCPKITSPSTLSKVKIAKRLPDCICSVNKTSSSGNVELPVCASHGKTKESSQSQSKKKGGGSSGGSSAGSTKEPTPKAVPVPAHIQAAINYEQNRVLAPDYSRCFENMRDATMRLLPYHVIQDMAYDEKFLKKEDAKFEIKAEKLLDRTRHLFHRFKCAMLKDSLKEAPISDFALLSRLSMQSETQDLEALKQLQLDQTNILPLNCSSSLNQPPPSNAAVIETDQSRIHFNDSPSLQPPNYQCANTGLPITNLKPTEFPIPQDLNERGMCNNLENSSFTLAGSNPSRKLSVDESQNAQVLGSSAATFTDVQQSSLGPPPNVKHVYHCNEAGFPSQKLLNKLEPMENLEYSMENSFSRNVLQSNLASNEDSEFINTIMQMKCEISDCDQIQQQQNLNPAPLTIAAVVSDESCTQITSASNINTISSPSSNALAASVPFTSPSSSLALNYNNSADLQQQQSKVPQNQKQISSSSSSSKVLKKTTKTQKIIANTLHTNQVLSSTPHLTQSEAEQAVNSILL